ncbi:MAG TPA: universal stress protein [Terracidiphilus sp.]|nr:universal stress protein [Terracidiphilus sp.]
MVMQIKQGWTKPSTVLFASEIPTNEAAARFALAEARQFGATLILFHAFDTMIVAASETSGIRYFDYAAAAHAEIHHLEPLAQQARSEGIDCEIVVRPGLAADQIIGFLREREVDRIVLGTRAPGPLGKLLIGSVAEAVLRASPAPALVIGPQVADARFRNYATRTIICGVTLREGSPVEAALAAQLAAQHHARLVLLHAISPQQRTEELAGRTMESIEADMLALAPDALRKRITVLPIVVPGDPAEELLFQARAQEADLIVLGAHTASTLAAVTRQGVVSKVLAQAQCPVLTLSPAVLAACGVHATTEHAAEVFLSSAF